MKIFDLKSSLENHTVIKECMDFLAQNGGKNIELGKHEIREGLYVAVSEYWSRSMENLKWEAHREYVDFQVILEGEENLYVSNISKMHLGEYKKQEDYQQCDGEYERIIHMTSDKGVLLLPEDAHMPGVICGDKTSFVKKAVFKIYQRLLHYIDLREKSAISMHGFCMQEDSDTFSRMDTDVALKITESTKFNKTSVYSHARESAGGRARFCTDSSVIAIKTELSNYVVDYAEGMGAGKYGFDVYIDTDKGSTYYGTISPVESQLPSGNETWSYEGQIEFDTEEMRNVTIYFPIANEVSEVFVGVKAYASIMPNSITYDNMALIVFYGSSITQGGVVTRPGLTYVNTVGRMLRRDYIDLGVWGSAKGETRFAEYIAGLDMSVFVFDYDHNAPSVEHLENTHYSFYQIVRQAHPKTPIVFISRPGQSDDYAGRREVIWNNYRLAMSSGDSDVYFIDGQTFFEGEDDCLADGVHPTDKGHSLMAQYIGSVLADITGKMLPLTWEIEYNDFENKKKK